MTNAKMTECMDAAGIVDRNAYEAARNEIEARRAEVAAAFREHPELKKEFFSAICRENRAKANPENMRRSAECYAKMNEAKRVKKSVYLFNAIVDKKGR